MNEYAIDSQVSQILAKAFFSSEQGIEKDFFHHVLTWPNPALIEYVS